MTERLAIDFGVTNTVIAYWDKTEGRAKSLYIPGISRPARYLPAANGPDSTGIYVIPSIIQYRDDGTVHRIGQRVFDANRNIAVATHVFCNMRPEVLAGRRTFRQAGSRSISRMDAAADFLGQVIQSAVEVLGGMAGITFTAPTTANTAIWQRYHDWLVKVACGQGIRRVRLLEEPWAAAWGAGLGLQPGQIYLFLDFGGRTVTGTMVLVDNQLAAGDRFLRILSQTDDDLGGVDADNWLASEVLERYGLQSNTAVELRETVLAACEKARERLSVYDKAEIQVSWGGHSIQTVLTRIEVEEILTANGFLAKIEAALRQVLKGAEGLGYSLNSLQGVVLAGGLSIMPSVRELVYRFFAGIPVYDRQPVDAVACGAAALAAGEDACGYIRHSYGLRYLTGEEYCYKSLVVSGLFYPSAGPVATVIIKASYDRQRQYGLFIYRQGNAGEQDGNICLNADNPLIISVEYPAEKGEAALKIEFYVDGNRCLVAKIWDLSQGCVIIGDKPVTRLI